MSWAAANAPKLQRDSISQDTITDVPRGQGRATETVEAALSRLSKAYTTSMECIGALNKTNLMLEKDLTKITDETVGVLERVATAARTTLEHAILLDPLVLPHVQTANGTMYDFLEREDNSSARWEKVRGRRPEPPVLSSAAHKTTIRELAYLALVNYSDLLQSCCPCESQTGSTIDPTCCLLDRGVVKKISTLQARKHCCWKGESEEDTQRLAVTALCDASKLDGSDPTMWLKLACASRRLERLVQAVQPSTLGRSKHRRLQRYALEQGSQCLPPHMPPNRAIQRALKELLNEPEPDTYVSLPPSNDTIKLKLDLPRYSWSVLGRMLLRASREGADYQGDHNKNQSEPRNFRPKMSIQFGSPMIEMNLSPMLILPTRVLGKICLYLDNGSIWRFEATCRALSAAIMSARAIMEEEMTSSRTVIKELAQGKEPQGAASEPSSEPQPYKQVAENKPENRKSKSERKCSNENHRSSQRLRSQQITSGKKAERLGNRQSFEYCFLAATTGTTIEDHREGVTEAQTDDRIRQLLPGLASGRGSPRRRFFDGHESRFVQASKRREAQEPIGDSSLAAFVERWSSRNSGPMDLIMQFLVHIAMNAEEVFSSDPGGTVALTSCILSCFEACSKRSGFHEQLVPQFYKSTTHTGSLKSSLEGFAVDVLHGELLLKQCDRYSPVFVAYDDDSNMISMMVPNLFETCNELDNTINKQKVGRDLLLKYALLKARCFWLIAGFYLWRSRAARLVWEAQEAEEEGTTFIEKALNALKSPNLQKFKSLKTPQLVSPGRTEAHWKEISVSLLSKYRDEIQASSVVSQVREKFQDIVARIISKNESSDTEPGVTNQDASDLAEIGETLFQRYRSGHGDSESKHSELVEDFLSFHGNDILPLKHENEEPRAKSSISGFLPVQRVDLATLRTMTQPSILSMLVVCMNMKSSNQFAVLKLLLNLALSTRDIHQELCQRIHETRLNKKGADEDDFSDSEDDSIASDDSTDRNASNKNMDEKRAIQCGHMMAFLLERILESLKVCLGDDDRACFISSGECQLLMRCSLEMASRWFDTTSKYVAPEDTADLSIFKAASRLSAVISNNMEQADRPGFDARYFESLIGIFIMHRQVLAGLVQNHGDRSTRISKQKMCIKRAEFIAEVAADIGMLLSQHLGIVQDLVVVPSEIIMKNKSSHSSGTDGTFDMQWNVFVDSVLWLWKFSSQNLSESAPTAVVCSSFDRPMVKSLRVPVASVVIGLCGSAASSRTRMEELFGGDDPLCLSEFYDSDASANDFYSDDEGHGEERDKQKEFLRVVCHAVQCIHLVISKIDDKGALSIVPASRFIGLGPLLPLVANRVLNHFADSLLRNLPDENQEQPNIWATEYPFRAHAVGELLDSDLHKVYRWLFGFVLIGEKSHQQSSGKDLATSLSPIVDLTVKDSRLESVAAAAQLYRCIVRAYDAGRRSPPKKALELISSALPPVVENKKSIALRSFLFTTSGSYFTMNEISRLVQKDESWDSPFEPIRRYLYNDEASEKDSPRDSEELEDIIRVRRGILSELASGQLPLSNNDVSKSKSDLLSDDDRIATAKNEKEIAKKFDAIINDLCLGDVESSEGWYRAAQCINTKAELIADRLGLSLGFARSNDFAIPLPQPRSIKGMKIDKLLKEQEEEDCIINDNWIQVLGDDLSLYVKFPWAEFDSLLAGAEEIGKCCCATEYSGAKKSNQRIIWKSIQRLYRKGDYLAWQEAWGGIFVYALRKLAVRFLAVAVYLLLSKAETKPEENVLISELCETLGISFYTDLMGSQCYGFPMQPMGPKRKRELATTSRICFDMARRIIQTPKKNDDHSDESHATWDLIFMTGKCDEKIAGTYKLEDFSGKEGDVASPRQYEKNMASALTQYAAACAQAKNIEEDGGFIVDQSGGSAHGCTEIMYRLLATRLKILISAATRVEVESQHAEEEALRLTEQYWFKPPENLESLTKEHIRDRVWTVLVDVVSGLAQCRVDQPFFHRSVYRHAQALMWSPILYDPTSSEGSLDSVPATRGFQIRGLNNSTPVVQSAEIVMNNLFDKKRSQLAAVWVTTTTSSSPFQMINNSTRKYDSLRGKYIAAYLDTLRLSQRRGKLENFLKWVYSTRRDLPGYFQASAMAENLIPAKTHASDPLLVMENTLYERSFLTTVKRQANHAFSEVLMHEITDRSNRITSPCDGQKAAETYLKFAYAAYLRLNCSREDLDKIGAWKYGRNTIPEVEAVCQGYVALGEDADSKTTGKADFGDWSGKGRKAVIFDAAIAKCKVLFPTLSATFFSKKTTASSKSKTGAKEGEEGGKRKEGAHEEEEETTTVSFEVAVPAGVGPGESFFITVKVGGGTKKLKLTVPPTNPSTLRFSLKIPRETTPPANEPPSEEPATKKVRTESTEAMDMT